MPRLPGVGFDAGKATSAQIDKTIADVARNLTILRDLALPGWGWIGEDGHGVSASWPGWLHAQVTECAARLKDRLTSDFVTAAHQMIEGIAPVPRHGSILNGDLGLSHVLIDPPSGAVTGILDWAAAISGDPLYDVATFSMGGPAGDPIQAVLQPRLLAACGADPQDRRIRLYRAINHLFNAVWSVANGVDSWTDDLCRAAAELLEPAQ